MGKNADVITLELKLYTHEVMYTYKLWDTVAELQYVLKHA